MAPESCLSEIPERPLEKTSLSIVYNKTGPDVLIKPLAELVNSPSPEKKKVIKLKKPLVVYGSIN